MTLNLYSALQSSRVGQHRERTDIPGVPMLALIRAHIYPAVPWLCASLLHQRHSAGTWHEHTPAVLAGISWNFLCSQQNFCLWKMARIIPLQAGDFCLCSDTFHRARKLIVLVKHVTNHYFPRTYHIKCVFPFFPCLGRDQPRHHEMKDCI